MFYRETEFQDIQTGKIPSDWQAVTLSELSEHITKGTTPTTYGFNYESSGINFIKVESIDEHCNFVRKNIPHISKEANNALRRSMLKEKDILFSIAGALGRVALVTEAILPANTNQALAIVRIKEREKVLPEYLKYFLMGPNIQDFIKSIAIQSQQANLNLEQVRKFRIGLPSLSEQKTVVGVLGVVDSAIELADKVIAKTERLKEGLRHQLLTEGIGHIEYKNTPIGKAPKTWQISNLDSASEIIMGQSPPGETYNEKGVGTPLINGPTEFGEKRPIIAKWTTSPTKLTTEDDILICVRGHTTGRLSVSDGIYCIGRGVAAIRGNKQRLSNRFLYYVLEENKIKIFQQSYAAGSTFPNMTRVQLGKIQIPLPSINEQGKIADIIDAVANKLQIEKNEKKKLEKIKIDLMDLLLTGKVRIKVD
jgi:type I restriction enzyme S subunit